LHAKKKLRRNFLALSIACALKKLIGINNALFGALASLKLDAVQESCCITEYSTAIVVDKKDSQHV
jgi:hypothetical protein